MTKKILMIAGPNGAGKTTVAKALFPDFPTIYEFINADEIARGLAPLNPETMALKASKIMVKRLCELLSEGKSFAFETTASGINFLKYLKEAKEKGYTISLLYLWLPDPSQAISRVMQRVRHGGHHIDREIIRRRYYAGLKNILNLYLPIADSVLILDNSFKGPQKTIFRKNRQDVSEIKDLTTWKKMNKVIHE